VYIALNGTLFQNYGMSFDIMGSHSASFHPTQAKTPTVIPARQAGTRFTYPGGMEG